MTWLIASIRATSMEDLERKAAAAWRGGADCVELRIDEFNDDPRRIAAYLEGQDQQQWILTCRSVAEGGASVADASDRASRLVSARGESAAVIDFEYADFSGSPDVRGQLPWNRDGSGENGITGILSHHVFDGDPPDVAGICGAIAKIGPRIIPKVAYAPRDIADSFVALDAIHAARAPVMAVAMNEDGFWTRVLAKKLGACGTYAALDESSATAAGQFDLRTAFNRYHWPSINAETRVFGVLGDPVAHSMGPRLINAWFEQHGINAVYLPLRVSRERSCLKRFLDGCQARPWLDLRGFSITIPHKEAVLHWAGAGTDATARSIGAANTLVPTGDKWAVHNTDCHAAIDSLCASLACDRGDLSGRSVDVLGCGGAARAVLAGLQAFGCRVTVYGRSPKKTRSVAGAFGAKAKPWTQRTKSACDVMINATPIGMSPYKASSPMPVAGLEHRRLVFDLVYNPLETTLLGDARSLGVATLNGLDMFVRQAAAQFQLWTGQTPDLAAARRTVAASLSNGQTGESRA